MSSALDTFSGISSKIMDVLPRTADIVYKSSVHRSISEESKPFADRHPLASYFVFMLTISIPDLFLSVALGVPYVKNALTLDRFIVASFVWYLTFFSPRDIFHRLVTDKISKTIIGIFCEINRKNIFSRLTDRAFKMSSVSYFSAMTIPTMYCLSYMLSIYPIDQIMRASPTTKHEAKSPHLGSMIVLMYATSTSALLYCQNMNIPWMNAMFDTLTIPLLHQTLMMVAIFMSVFNNLTGMNPLSFSIARLSRASGPTKSKKSERASETTSYAAHAKIAPIDEDDTPSDVMVVDSPRRGKASGGGGPGRKRRSSKPNA